MRVGASSGAWMAAVFTFVAFGLGFLVLVLPIPSDVAFWLMWLSFLLAGIAGYGAWRAHYRKVAEPSGLSSDQIQHFSVAVDRRLREDLPLNAQKLGRVLQPKEPDVTLEFANTGPFILRNFGETACEVQIECESLNENALFDVAFPIVGDLHDAPIVVTPEIDPSTLYGKDKDIMNVLHAIVRDRAKLVQGSNSNSIETSRIIISEMEPIRFHLGVSYTDRHKSKRWWKNENLVYDPRKKTAYIEHGSGTPLIEPLR